MPVCSHVGYAGNGPGTGVNDAVNYLMDANGASQLSPNVLALFLLADDPVQATLECNYSFASGAEYVALSKSGMPLEARMPTCLKRGFAGSVGIGARSSVNYLMDSTGTAPITPNVLAKFLLVDTVTPDISQCEAVALSGAEYAALSAPAAGGNMNVNADVFVGAVLVGVFVLGWIAGAQR